jgi:hypothetical protein
MICGLAMKWILFLLLTGPLEAAHDDPLEAAREAFLKGEYQKAIQLAQPLTASNPYPAWKLIGAARCFLKDKPGAQEAWGKLDQEGRTFLRYVCARNAISLP